MKLSKKSTIIIFGTIGALVILPILFLIYIRDDLNIEGTLSTKYHLTNNPKEQIIETEYFELRTPQNWIHIFGGHGVEGDPYGRFITENGIIFYEYGNFPPDYNEDNEIYDYKVDKVHVGRFKVNIARNNKKETGIAILPQHEMDRVLTFYLDESVTKNFNNLIKGVESLKFKEGRYKSAW